MDSPPANSALRDLISHRFFVPVILGLAVLGVLVQGAAKRGAPAVLAAAAEPEPRNEPPVALRSGLDPIPLEYFSEYWFQLGVDVRQVLVEIGPSRTPGVVVAPGIALSTLQAADEVRRASFSPESWQDSPAAESEDAAEKAAQVPAPAPVEAATDRVLLLDSSLGLALFEAPGLEPAQPLATADSSLSYPGALVAAVGLASEGWLRIAPGHLGSSMALSANDTAPARLEVTIHIPFLRGAAAIVDLNGELLGVAVEGTAEPRMIAWPTIRALLERLSSGEPCRAIEVSDLDAAAMEILKLSRGVLVEAVRSDAFESAASVRAGDILLDWAGEPVTDAAGFPALYDAAEAGGSIAVVVRRNGRTIRGQATVPASDCRPVADPPESFAALGFAAHWKDASKEEGVPPGWQVVAVRPGGRTDSFLEPNDRLVSLNGRTLQGPASARSLKQYAPSRTALVGVWRRGRVLLSVLPSPESNDP